MKYSHRLSDAVHILTYIGASDIVENDLSSRAIAGSINSNPSLVRRLMSSLKNAGLITSKPGRAAVSLSKPTTEITLLDVYKAIEEPDLFHVDEETNQQCPVGANIQSALHKAYGEVQQQAEIEMSKITLSDIVKDVVAGNQKALS
ncbi:Transcriptional regulator, BadM/Rrf2 family [Apilactobacillus kunkeei]|uniref:Rrf2 family transcriptional regulator n=1 Tax=Apilactobacillus kunkeei TaxID=148814 RepID=UPI0006CE629A|nr:Rrf2 family transcriptional regulator [Apilactobacillus kunkeei]KPN80487.1 Transcriptional regulator, BadM/Rrf2 family [Apilactobacillus kunkeei]